MPERMSEDLPDRMSEYIYICQIECFGGDHSKNVIFPRNVSGSAIRRDVKVVKPGSRDDGNTQQGAPVIYGDYIGVK